MQTTPPNDGKTQTGSAPGGNNAFMALATLPPGTDKNTLITTIDNAVTQVLSELANHEEGNLPGDILMKVQTSLSFLEQCLGFKDEEFTEFSKKRANELQMALGNTIARIQEAKAPPPSPEPEPEPEAKPEPEAEEAPVEAEAVQEPEEELEEDEEEEPFDPKAFPYPREEKILIDYAYKKLCERLGFLRGDHVVSDGRKQKLVSDVHEDGVAPFFLFSTQFPEILRQPFIDLVEEKRDLLSRRVYIHTDKDDSDEDVLKLYQEERHRDIIGIIGLAFDDWAGEIARAGIAGLPQEIKIVGPKKEESSAGIGSSLKKVFSFGKKEKKAAKKVKAVDVPDTNPIRIHKEWQVLEKQGVFDLSPHFSFSLLSYALQLSEKQFNTEFECICQIVNQQEEPDVGPVITNLNRLYKFYDNIFFDLVILNLFYRQNNFDVNMLQAACMSQNFVVDRLPLTMDELKRRPMEHAKNVLACLKTTQLNPEKVKQALEDYFFAHQTIHSSKVGKRIQASENLIKRQGDKLTGNAKEVINEIDSILHEVAELKARQEEDGVFLGEEIETAVEDGITRAVAHVS
ncbi:hypothetical protein MTBPR1_40074 [Candidatus Terasakiella magnetica]|uniref:Uncharacterized protein n=1 Tax=Candidatus Terasakiella magnetica TaxID=1867952 RepID=A0A1C3RIF1_9PROT|nr:hypothetical protein [Candidatus Terasakiella magnetica]SCA57051.1 hypothetical protein MTBPR1_40074 [Candidatus Terasakiella magnetica]